MARDSCSLQPGVVRAMAQTNLSRTEIACSDTVSDPSDRFVEISSGRLGFFQNGPMRLVGSCESMPQNLDKALVK